MTQEIASGEHSKIASGANSEILRHQGISQEIATDARDTAVIAAEINAIKAQARAQMLGSAVEIGRRLVELKGMVPHGRWGAWLEENVEYSERTAQDLMRVFEEYGKNPNPQALADLGYTQAVALLRLTGEERGAFLAAHDVEGMSTRELEAEIAALREEKARQQVTMDELVKKAEGAKKLATAAEGAMAKAKEKAAKEEGKARAAAERADKAEAVLADWEAKAPEIVERVPEEVKEELERLRRVAAKAPNELVIRFRDAYARLATEFEGVARLIGEMEDAGLEEAGQYRGAVRKAVERMMGMVES